jgi:hypothetical protein
MAPNLFLNSGKKSGASLREVEMAKGTINIVRMLIKYHSILWTVSVIRACSPAACAVKSKHSSIV